jgi:hypothetical protein
VDVGEQDLDVASCLEELPDLGYWNEVAAVSIMIILLVKPIPLLASINDRPTYGFPVVAVPQ